MSQKYGPRARFRTFLILTTLSFTAVTSIQFASPASAQKKTGKMSTLTTSCGSNSASSIDILVCAGATGAPAGFSVQWMTKAEYDALGGWPVSSEVPNLEAASFCKASFSGNANNSRYDLAPGECVVVNIGDNLFDDPGASSPCANQPLACGTEYVFRTFAHANSTKNRSDFSAALVCGTDNCVGGGCTFTQGFWKTHYPDSWPADVIVNGLTLGTVSYTAAQLEDIFNKPAMGNGLISLAHQLIAAKLNMANGADGSALGSTIGDADALIGGLVIPPVGGGFLHPSVTSTLNTVLTSYNEGTIGPGHCE